MPGCMWCGRNGSKVFFVTEGQLTGEAWLWGLPTRSCMSTEVSRETGAACKLTSVGRAKWHARGCLVGGVLGSTVPAISADGCAVYFTAFGALAPGGVEGGAQR